ncbi:MAG TPA: response regulator [Patescibacteria group bacterium]|nr:response regulator [Patescibacteria group bacterium]
MNEMLSILLVDDDEVDVQNIQRSFRKLGIINPLRVAMDGLVALEILQTLRDKAEELPGLILLDLNMPRMNGLEFLERLRHDPDLRCLCVVVLTTSAEEKDVVEAYQYNVAGYVVKPVTMEAFFEAMSTINKYWKLCERPCP